MLLPFSIAGELHIGQSGIAGSKLPLLQPSSMPVDQRGRDQAGKMDDRHGDNKHACLYKNRRLKLDRSTNTHICVFVDN